MCYVCYFASALSLCSEGEVMVRKLYSRRKHIFLFGTVSVRRMADKTGIETHIVSRAGEQSQWGIKKGMKLLKSSAESFAHG